MNKTFRNQKVWLINKTANDAINELGSNNLNPFEIIVGLQQSQMDVLLSAIQRSKSAKQKHELIQKYLDLLQCYQNITKDFIQSAEAEMKKGLH